MFAAMSGMARTLALAVVVAGIAVAGCGGGDDKTSSGGGDKTSSTSTSAASSPGLARAVYPKSICVPPQFRKPVATPSTDQRGGRAWQVSFLLPGLAKHHPGDTTNVLVIEQSPALPQETAKRGQPTFVAGRRVSLRSPDAQSRVFLAVWRTKRAGYVVIANGNRPETLKRFIGCLP